jgi:hypothetical protein
VIRVSDPFWAQPPPRQPAQGSLARRGVATLRACCVPVSGMSGSPWRGRREVGLYGATVIVPFMCSCTRHSYVNVPAFGKENVKLSENGGNGAMIPDVATKAGLVIAVPGATFGAGLMGISGWAQVGAPSAGVPSHSGGGAHGGSNGSTELNPVPVSGKVTVCGSFSEVVTHLTLSPW